MATNRLSFRHVLESSNQLTDAQYVAARNAGYTDAELRGKTHEWITQRAAWIWPGDGAAMTEKQYTYLRNFVDFDDIDPNSVTFLEARKCIRRLLLDDGTDERYCEAQKNWFASLR